MFGFMVYWKKRTEVVKYGDLDEKALTAGRWCYTSLANQETENR